MATTVTNINGTSNCSCGCGSWIRHWERVTGKLRPHYCTAVGCYKSPTVGGHVQKQGSSAWWIVPICQDHNTSGKAPFTVSGALASANKALTCGK